MIQNTIINSSFLHSWYTPSINHQGDAKTITSEAVQERSWGKKTWLLKASVHSEPNNSQPGLVEFPCLFIRFTRLKQASHVVPSSLHLDVQACKKHSTDFGTEAKGQTRNMLTSEGQNHKDKQSAQQQPYTSTAERKNQCFPPLFWSKFITAAFVCLVSCHSSVIALPRF